MSMERAGVTIPPRIEKSPSQVRNNVTQSDSPGSDEPASFASLLIALDADTALGSEPPVVPVEVIPQSECATPGVAALPADPMALLAQSMVRESGTTTSIGADGVPERDAPTAVAMSVLRPATSSTADGWYPAFASPAAGKPVSELAGSMPAPEVGDATGAYADQAVAPKLLAADALSSGRANQVVAQDLAPPTSGRGLPQPVVARHGTLSNSRDDGARVAADLSKADWWATHATQADRLSFSAAPMPAEAGGGFRALVAPRTIERQGGLSWLAANDAAPIGSASAGPGSFMGAAGVTTPEAPVAAGAPAAVAEKVHYWISRGVQNAELQLDAFGGGSVDVSITLRGNEAQVEFRTDQPEARKLLQDAMPQLRDLLKSEGLLLAGGFVGTSDHQESQAQPRRQSGSTVRTTAVAAPTTSQPLRLRVGQPGSVDVFV